VQRCVRLFDGRTFTPLPLQLSPPVEFSFRDSLEVIRRRKAGFFQVFILVFANGVLGTLASTPIYRASAKLLGPIASPTVSVLDARMLLSSHAILARARASSGRSRLTRKLWPASETGSRRWSFAFTGTTWQRGTGCASSKKPV
jgi:hypothetical protein